MFIEQSISSNIAPFVFHLNPLKTRNTFASVIFNAISQCNLSRCIHDVNLQVLKVNIIFKTDYLIFYKTSIKLTVLKMVFNSSIDSNVASFVFPHNPLISVLNQKQFTSIIFIPALHCNPGRLMHETYWLGLKANIIYQNGLAYFG
jgi:hypothetical protein